MNVLVVSDTHGHLAPLRRLQLPAGPTALLHAGDFYGDAAPCARLFGVRPEATWAVAGNCDYPQEEPREQVLELGGCRILLTHGHRLDVKRSYLPVLYRALELRCRVAVFGHSHVAVCVEEQGVLLLNPGSPAFPRGPGAPGSVGWLELAGGKVSGKILQIPRQGAFDSPAPRTI